jgi:hypothetical protein
VTNNTILAFNKPQTVRCRFTSLRYSLLNDTYFAYTEVPERFINTFKFRNKDSGILSYIFAQLSLPVACL